MHSSGSRIDEAFKINILMKNKPLALLYLFFAFGGIGKFLSLVSMAVKYLFNLLTVKLPFPDSSLEV